MVMAKLTKRTPEILPCNFIVLTPLALCEIHSRCLRAERISNQKEHCVTTLICRYVRSEPPAVAGGKSEPPAIAGGHTEPSVVLERASNHNLAGWAAIA